MNMDEFYKDLINKMGERNFKKIQAAKIGLAGLGLLETGAPFRQDEAALGALRRGVILLMTTVGALHG